MRASQGDLVRMAAVAATAEFVAFCLHRREQPSRVLLDYRVDPYPAYIDKLEVRVGCRPGSCLGAFCFEPARFLRGALAGERFCDAEFGALYLCGVFGV